MGDLFDGYSEALARQNATAIVPPFDEMFAGENQAGDLDPRRAYSDLHQVLADMTQDQIRHRSDALADSYLAQGVTFDFAGEERPFPLDVVPRVIERSEWLEVERGLKQRVRALEQFLDDTYGAQRAIADGVIPASLIATSSHFHRVAMGIRASNGVRIQVSGIDLVRDENGVMRVLEDNVRVPSGVSYVISNRRAMAQTLPELFTRMRVLPIGDYAYRLLGALRAAAPEGVEDPTVVVLTPGVYNSAYFEHTLLARLMGIELVEGRDLFCSGGRVYMRTTAGARRVDVIYRRVDDDFLDPMQFRQDSMLGAPGLMTAARQGNVTIANAVGNGVADDKLVYTYLPDLIRYYLAEEPIIPNVDTWRLEEPNALEEVLDRLDELVVKPVDGSGGKGLMIGPRATQAERDKMRQRLLADPRGWIAQPVVQLSTIPTLVDDGIRPRHADLRPFAVNDGSDVWVLPGGLTRVAMPEGQLVVNSSQGGGSKDTWVVSTEGSSTPTPQHGVEDLLDDQADTSDTPHPATGVIRIIPPEMLAEGASQSSGGAGGGGAASGTGAAGGLIGNDPDAVVASSSGDEPPRRREGPEPEESGGPRPRREQQDAERRQAEGKGQAEGQGTSQGQSQSQSQRQSQRQGDAGDQAQDPPGTQTHSQEQHRSRSEGAAGAGEGAATC